MADYQPTAAEIEKFAVIMPIWEAKYAGMS